MLRIAASILTLVVGLVVLVPAASAAVSRDDAAALAQRKAPGRVLSVERGLHVDNSVVWRIQVLTAGGEVRLFVIDAESGRFR